jgi:RES domain-containing protein
MAFTGEGAKLYGGRWNSRGKRATYAAESIALAALELLVHLKSDQVLSAYTLFQLTLDDDQIMVLDEQVLPADWNHQPAPQSTAQIGDEWLGKCLSLALKIPSIIVPEEYIFVLNPAHEDYPDVVGRAGSHPFQFDSRLAT